MRIFLNLDTYLYHLLQIQLHQFYEFNYEKVTSALREIEQVATEGD